MNNDGEYGCINCGEAHDGGYLSGWEGHIDEGAVGPFCSECWELLRETFHNPVAYPSRDARVGITLNHEANEYARLFNRHATMHGYDLQMSLLAELIALFEVALSSPVGAVVGR